MELTRSYYLVELFIYLCLCEGELRETEEKFSRALPPTLKMFGHKVHKNRKNFAVTAGPYFYGQQVRKYRGDLGSSTTIL